MLNRSCLQPKWDASSAAACGTRAERVRTCCKLQLDVAVRLYNWVLSGAERKERKTIEKN